MEANYPPYNWTQNTDAHGAVPIDGSKQFANGYDVQIAKIIGKNYIDVLLLKKLSGMDYCHHLHLAKLI